MFKSIIGVIVVVVMLGLSPPVETLDELVPIEKPVLLEVIPAATVEVIAPVITYNVPLSNELQMYTYKVCEEYGIPTYFSLILAMMWQESNFTPSRISATHDYGIMQINKSNHKWLSEKLGTVDFLDAKQNIKAGVYMISVLLLKYSNAHQALMVYNFGGATAQRHWKAGTYSSKYSRSILQKQATILE